jgi:hypothetical protein
VALRELTGNEPPGPQATLTGDSPVRLRVDAQTVEAQGAARLTDTAQSIARLAVAPLTPQPQAYRGVY